MPWDRNSGAGGGGSGDWVGAQVIYVGKHGNDANTGFSMRNAKLTFTNAMATALALVPGAANRFSIWCEDAGVYTESFAVRSYCEVVAPAAAIIGSINMEANTAIFISEIQNTIDGNACLACSGANVEIHAGRLINLGDTLASRGLYAAANNVKADIQYIEVDDGAAIYMAAGSGFAQIDVRRILITDSGYGIQQASAPGTILSVTADEISDGAATGTAIVCSSGTIDAKIGHIDCNSRWNLTGGTTRLLVSDLQPGTEAAVIGLRLNSTYYSEQLFYVSKDGLDTNDGRTKATAKLTFGAALAAANALTPSTANRFAIVCEDAGVYAENLTIYSWCRVFAPSASIGLLSMQANSEAKFQQLTVPSGNTGISMTVSGIARVEIDEITVGAGSIGFLSANQGAILMVKCKTVSVGAGSFAGGDGSSGDGHLHIEIGDIYLDGISASALGVLDPGTVVGHVDHILERAAYATTVGLYVPSGYMKVSVNELVADTAYNVGATGILRLFVNEISGLRSVTTGGLDSVTTAGSVIGTATSIAAGAGYVTIQTTEALLTAANQSCRVGFQVDHNEILASLVTWAGDIALMVAWLDDDTQTIQNLADGTTASGAAPSITGTLVSGVGWQATLNANHQVVLEFAKDAANTQSAQSRYWVGERVAQIAP